MANRANVARIKAGLGSLVLALGIWTAAKADSAYTVTIHLQTDRPTYVLGQTIRVRFIIATETALSYWIGYTPDLKVVNTQFKPLRNSGVDNPFESTGGPGDRREFRPGMTTLETYGWRRARVMRQWFDLSSLGYHIDQPGKYTIVADGSLEDYRVISSPPVTIYVLTTAAARMQSSDVLGNTSTNGVFRKLANKYVRLRSRLIRMVATVGKGGAWQDFAQERGHWEQERDDVQNQIDGLSSSGNPSSPYVQITANLENAVEALGAAGERTFSCDVPNAAVNLAVSNYFFAAVQRELTTGRANVADAANPPPYASPSGYCKDKQTQPTPTPVWPSFLNTPP